MRIQVNLSKLFTILEIDKLKNNGVIVEDSTIFYIDQNNDLVQETENYGETYINYFEIVEINI